MKNIFILLSLATATATLASLPTVNIDSLGTVTGAISKLSDTVAVYHAIPYAKPPTDKLRWQPPVEYGAFIKPPSTAPPLATDACPLGTHLMAHLFPKTASFSMSLHHSQNLWHLFQ